jgi:hypothetical protein
MKCICGKKFVQYDSVKQEHVIAVRVVRADLRSGLVQGKCPQCKRWVKLPLAPVKLP